MAKSSSKRKRKEKDKLSLKYKSSAVNSALDLNDLLSDELRNECALQHSAHSYPVYSLLTQYAQRFVIQRHQSTSNLATEEAETRQRRR